MSGKVAGTSVRDPNKAVKKSPPRASRTSTSRGGGNQDDSNDINNDNDEGLVLGEINLFDYLVESTLHMDPPNHHNITNSSFSSILSASSTTSRRRAHQLRVKRYTGSGEEVTVDGHGEAPPESAPAWASSHQESASSLYSASGGKSFSQLGGNRSARAKRYHTVDITPSPIQSDAESDMEGGQPHYALDSTLLSSTPAPTTSTRTNVGLAMNVSENEPDHSYIFEDQESGEEQAQDDDGSAHARSNQVLPTKTPGPNQDIYVDANDENDSGVSALRTSANLAAAYHTKGDRESTSGQAPGEVASVPHQSNMYYNPHPQDEYQPATSTRERESILKKQAAGLAAAAAGRVQEKRESAGAHDLSNHTTDPTRKVQLGGEPLHVDGNSTRGDGNPMPQDDLGNTRTQRIQALEQRKRELEALAREASLRRAAMQEQESRKKHSRPAYRNRTVNIDVYTGEVIGDLPKIEEERKAQGRSKNEDDSSSVHSTTEYDLPITKASRSRRIVLFGLLIIALTLGLYFGITRSKDNVNSDTSALETLPPVSSPASNLPTIIDVPTLKPTAHPTSLRSPTEPETSFPIYVPTTPNPTTDPFNNTDPGLLDLVLAEWPLLMEAVLDESSPQVQALEWLSSDEGLDTYSNSQKMQRFALATFYYSTGGAMWLNDDGWLSTDDECTWFTTSGTNPCNQDGSYISLELINNNLNGTIPAELALLSNNLITVTLIRELDQLSLYGTIPTEMGLLTQLQFFNVRGHELEGPIPSEFGNVTGLRRLIVRQNMLSGEIPSELGVLTRLRFLELEDNRLVGSIPSEIGQLTLLESILVARNQLTGDIPSQIGQWTAMGTFSASMNGFTSIPTEIGNLSSLLSMDLVGNKLRGTIPSEVGKLSKLSRLELGNNSLSGTIPTTIGNLILLAEDLDLSENQLSGPIPTEFGRLVVLRQLLLNSNQLTGQIPTEFRALSRLDILRLESTMLSGSVPDSVCSVFDTSMPLFVTDCSSDVVCDCCTHCCNAQGVCDCVFPATSYLQYRCIGFP